MKKLIVLMIFAVSQMVPFAANARHVVHQWRIVDLLQNGTFCFEGSDAKWYYYKLPSPPNAFVPTDVPDVYLLPQGGTWSASDSSPAPDAVKEEEKAVVQFDNKGYPTDGQLPPVDAPPGSN